MLSIRRATVDDLPALVAMLADDELGAARERWNGRDVDGRYLTAFAEIDGDPHQELVVGEQHGGGGAPGAVVATLHLTILPSLTYIGRPRAQIEAVRVRSDQRGSGLGAELFAWAIERARERGCHMVQLTTDAKRPDAARFYEGLGFVGSHVGMKLVLP